MTTLYHQVSIATSPIKLFERLSTEDGIGSWWDRPKAIGTADRRVLEFRPGPEHGVLKMKVVHEVPGRLVEWQCISTHPGNSPASAWTDTSITFEITAKNSGSVLNFRHSGWNESSEYLGFCNYQWGVALQKLKQVSESMS